MKTLTLKQLRAKADAVRRDIVKVCVANGAGHIAPSLSCVDVLVELYYDVMRRAKDPAWAGRDRLVFSKAHGCYGVYAILADIGYIARADWDNFYKGSFLSGCIEQNTACGIEAGCGSLGHGLPMAAGIAFGAKLQGKNYRTYCIVGDGEMQEGSNWEAVPFAVKHGLNNLTVIIDRNGLQAMDFLEDVLTVRGRKDDLERKFAAFGCAVSACDGHSFKALRAALRPWRDRPPRAPQVLLADTVKGCGLKCMENVAKFHFRLPTAEELKQGDL